MSMDLFTHICDKPYNCDEEPFDEEPFDEEPFDKEHDYFLRLTNYYAKSQIKSSYNIKQGELDKFWKQYKKYVINHSEILLGIKPFLTPKQIKRNNNRVMRCKRTNDNKINRRIIKSRLRYNNKTQSNNNFRKNYR